MVFQRRNRDAQSRQLLNAAELVEACNRWQYTAPSGAVVRALCWEVRPGGGGAAAAASGVEWVVVAANLLHFTNDTNPHPPTYSRPPGGDARSTVRFGRRTPGGRAGGAAWRQLGKRLFHAVSESRAITSGGGRRQDTLEGSRQTGTLRADAAVSVLPLVPRSRSPFPPSRTGPAARPLSSRHGASTTTFLTATSCRPTPGWVQCEL